MPIQSIIFDREHWTKAKAIAWLKSHRHLHNKYHLTQHHRRFRQYDPIKGESYYTMKVPRNEGIKFVIGFTKRYDKK